MAEPHEDVWRDVLTPTVFLERTVRVFPERVAVIHGEEEWSWSRFAQEVGRLAGALRRAGVGPGDRVAVLLPNTPVHLAAHFAMPLLADQLAKLLGVPDAIKLAPVARLGSETGDDDLLSQLSTGSEVLTCSDACRLSPC